MPPTENPVEHTALAVEPVDPEIVDGVLLDASRVVVGQATAAIAMLRGKTTSCTYVMNTPNISYQSKPQCQSTCYCCKCNSHLENTHRYKKDSIVCHPRLVGSSWVPR